MASTICFNVQGRDKPEITSDGCSTKTLLPLINELKDNMTKLDKNQCYELVINVLNIDWLNQELIIIDKYKAFVLDFISVYPNYIKIVLKTLVKKFEICKIGFYDDGINIQHVHDLLLDIYHLIPMMPNDLIPVLNKMVPYYLHDVQIQGNYISNLLHLINYMPFKQKDILDIIINQIIQLDVHLPKKEFMEMDLNGEDIEVMNKSINTLDTLMDYLFVFIRDSCYVDGQLNWESTKKLYQDVLNVFNNRILTTQVCSHVPFLLFYLCSVKLSLCENTIDNLWKKVENPNSPLVVRQMAVNYIASLLVYSLFVTVDLIATCIDVLSKWIHSYIDIQQDGQAIDPNLHRVFYSVSQALYFIFIYRHKDLLDMNNGFAYLQGLKFERMVTSSLNPLRWCHPNIVVEFASITRHYQLAYCDTIINRNLRFFLPTENAVNVLVDFNFPLSYYLLEKSKKFISSIYWEQKSINKEHESIEIEDDDFLNDIEMPDTNFIAFTQ